MDKTTFTSYYRVAQGYMQKSGLASNAEATMDVIRASLCPFYSFLENLGSYACLSVKL